MMMDQPIKKSMNRSEDARRMSQWAIEFTILDKDGALDEAKKWTIQIDGSSAQKRGGVGVIIITLEGETLKYGV